MLSIWLIAAGEIGQRDRHAVHMADRQQVFRVRLIRQVGLQLEGHHVIADTVAAIELRARDRLQAFAESAIQVELLAARSRPDRSAKLVVEAIVAVLRRTYRIEPGDGIVVLVGQCPELLLCRLIALGRCFFHCRRLGCGSIGVDRGISQQNGGRQRAEGNTMFHLSWSG